METPAIPPTRTTIMHLFTHYLSNCNGSSLSSPIHHLCSPTSTVYLPRSRAIHSHSEPVTSHTHRCHPLLQCGALIILPHSHMGICAVILHFLYPFLVYPSDNVYLIYWAWMNQAKMRTQVTRAGAANETGSWIGTSGRTPTPTATLTE